jgi:hypothetical protein
VLGLQPAERFAHRDPADAQPGGQLSLLELGAITKPPTHNGRLQLRIDTIGQSLTLDALQVIVSWG